jgi:hypothetical protein
MRVQVISRGSRVPLSLYISWKPDSKVNECICVATEKRSIGVKVYEGERVVNRYVTIEIGIKSRTDSGLDEYHFFPSNQERCLTDRWIYSP